MRRILQLQPVHGPARRTLPALLAARGGEKEWQEAQQLLEQPDSAQNASILDQRLQAVLFARRGGKERSF